VADAAAESPDDYVIATGKQHSVREFIDFAAELGMTSWQGNGGQKGIDQYGSEIVPLTSIFPPTEVDTLLGDASKANRVLGWEPKTSFEELVKEMVAADLELARRDALVREAGYPTFNYRE
jgi:GDPmannose 4,6-dehydratase